MHRFSHNSLQHLATCDARLQQLFMEVIKGPVDCKVLGGARTIEEQAELVRKGASRTMKSKHVIGGNVSLSRAVDVAPYYPEVPGGVDWRTDKALMQAVMNHASACATDSREMAGQFSDEVAAIVENIKRWHFFVGYVKGVAASMSIKVRNGSDWDADGRFDDHTFIDSPHWEIVED